MSSRKSHNARTAARSQSETRSFVLRQNQKIQQWREELDHDPDYKRAVHCLRDAEMSIRKKFKELQDAHNKLVQDATFSDLSDLVSPLTPLEKHETFYFDDVDFEVIRKFNILNHTTSLPVAQPPVGRKVEPQESTSRSPSLEDTTDSSDTQRSASESSPLTSTPPPPRRARPRKTNEVELPDYGDPDLVLHPRVRGGIHNQPEVTVAFVQKHQLLVNSFESERLGSKLYWVIVCKWNNCNDYVGLRQDPGTQEGRRGIQAHFAEHGHTFNGQTAGANNLHEFRNRFGRLIRAGEIPLTPEWMLEHNQNVQRALQQMCDSSDAISTRNTTPTTPPVHPPSSPDPLDTTPDPRTPVAPTRGSSPAASEAKNKRKSSVDGEGPSSKKLHTETDDLNDGDQKLVKQETKVLD